MQNAELFLRECKQSFSFPGLNNQHAAILNPNCHQACDDNTLALEIDRWQNCEKVPSISASYPIPVGSPVALNRATMNGQDPARSLLEQKYIHRKKLNSLLAVCKKYCPIEKIDETLKAAEAGTTFCHVDRKIAALAEHIALDPAPNITEWHNQYYGNNLVTVSYAGKSFLVHPRFSSPGCLSVVEEEFTLNKAVYHSVDHDMNRLQSIFQLDSYGDIISLRQLDKINLYRFSFDEMPVMENLLALSTEEIFLTNCFNKFNTRDFMALTLDATVSIYDIEDHVTPKQKLLVEFDDDSNAWGSLQACTPDILMYCNRKSAQLIDLRSSHQTVGAWNIATVADNCEEIYSACSGQMLQYITLSHHILSLDIRSGWHQKWAHGLFKAPFLIQPTSYDGSDLLVVTGDTDGDIACIQNLHSTEFSVDFIRNQPVHLPPLKECLHHARTLGHLLSPTIQSRFSMSIAGLQIVNRVNDICVCFCSSIGDLFSQQLCFNADPGCKTQFRDGELEFYEAWMNECHRMHIKSEDTIKATAIKDASDLIKLFEDEETGGMESDDDEEDSAPEVNQSRQTWMKSKRHLMNYCDFLAPRLLPVWSLDDDDDWGCEWPSDKETSEESSDSDELNDRVISWLSQSDPKLKMVTDEDESQEKT